MTEQLMAVFAFGLVITGIVVLGLARAKESAEKQTRAADASSDSAAES